MHLYVDLYWQKRPFFIVATKLNKNAESFTDVIVRHPLVRLRALSI